MLCAKSLSSYNMSCLCSLASQLSTIYAPEVCRTFVAGLAGTLLRPTAKRRSQALKKIWMMAVCGYIDHLITDSTEFIWRRFDFIESVENPVDLEALKQSWSGETCSRTPHESSQETQATSLGNDKSRGEPNESAQYFWSDMIRKTV